MDAPLQHNESILCLKVILNNQLLLLEIAVVELVVPIALLQEVPDEDRAFEGMLNYHGESIPVYHLNCLLNPKKNPDYAMDMPIIICNIKNQRLGILVNEAVDVFEINQADLQKSELMHLPDFVEGIIEKSQENMWLLNLEKLITSHLNLQGVS